MLSKFDSLLQSITKSQRFEVLVGLLTLSSVVLSLILYTEIETSNLQANAIYIFDLLVVAVLAFDFSVRTRVSKDSFRYAITHFYEIPAMIPLLAFALLEDPLVLGAAVRSIRFVRLFRLFRLANLFRIAEHWRVSTFVYLVIITAATIMFGAIAIYTVEENNETIEDFEDALWFSATTLTISGYGDVYPVTPYGRIIATILSFIGLAITLGFIANIGSALIESRLHKKSKKPVDEIKSSIIEKINRIEDLSEQELHGLISKIRDLHRERSKAKS